MQDRFQVTLEGQEIASDDLNLIAEEAANAEDYVIGTLFPSRVESGGTGKYVLPYRHHTSPYPLVRPKPSASSAVLVRPFHAYVAPISESDGTEKAFKNVRVAFYAGSSAGDAQSGEIAIAATTSSNRWDLIYARLDRDVNASQVTRAVKAVDDSISSQNVVTVERCSVTVAVLQGAEAAIPPRPALPSDSGGAYYIPLAYVRVVHPHTSATQIPTRQILGCAPLIPPSSGIGHAVAAPANGLWNPTGAIVASPSAGIDVSGVTRPPAYLPPTMMGLEVRTIALGFDGASTGRSVALNATHVLDDSIDWRNRLFFCSFQAGVSSSAGFAWNVSAPTNVWPSPGIAAAPSPGAQDAQYVYHGQSFQASPAWLSSFGIANAGPIIAMRNANFSYMSASSQLLFFVDMTDGKLKVNVSTADPGVYVTGLVIATGPNWNKGF